MPRKKFVPPPNLRRAISCGTCEHWQWGYEGEGTCKKYPDNYDKNHWGDSNDLCDDYSNPSANAAAK